MFSTVDVTNEAKRLLKTKHEVFPTTIKAKRLLINKVVSVGQGTKKQMLVFRRVSPEAGPVSRHAALKPGASRPHSHVGLIAF